MSTTAPSPRVVVLAGGLSHERDVSLRSGRRVADALRSVGVDVSVHDVDADLVPALVQLQPDLVWPLLHGASGEDGSVRDVVQLLGLRLLGHRSAREPDRLEQADRQDGRRPRRLRDARLRDPPAVAVPGARRASGARRDRRARSGSRSS